MRGDLKKIIPKPMMWIIATLFILCIVELLIGVGYSAYLSMTDQDLKDFKTEIIGSYAAGLMCGGAALILMSGTVFFKNIERHKQGLTTFSPNKHGSSEGGNFFFNQGINLMYLCLGGYLIYLAFLLLAL